VVASFSQPFPKLSGLPTFSSCQPSRFQERQCFDRIYPVRSRKIEAAKYVSSTRSYGNILRKENTRQILCRLC
jgi:hypothetical protein